MFAWAGSGSGKGIGGNSAVDWSAKTTMRKNTTINTNPLCLLIAISSLKFVKKVYKDHEEIRRFELKDEVIFVFFLMKKI
jgi:hypothetical protein